MCVAPSVSTFKPNFEWVVHPASCVGTSKTLQLQKQTLSRDQKVKVTRKKDSTQHVNENSNSYSYPVMKWATLRLCGPQS